MVMKHFVRFAKQTASGTIGPRGWRLRLFATANEASTFAREMVDKDWRVELGNTGDAAPDAPTAE